MSATRGPADTNVRDCRAMLAGMALDLPCPSCSSQMYAEQAHNRCPSCLYIEPCCDGAPQPCRVPSSVAAEHAPV